MLDKLKKLPGSGLLHGKGKTQEGEYLVALDIGTENVKALVAEVKGDDLEIIGVGRAHQELSHMQAGAIADIAGVVSNCERALTMAEQRAGISARTAVIGIAGELVKGKTTIVKCKRANPDKELDIAEVDKIIGLVQKRAEDNARRRLALELGGKDVEIKLVNSALVNIDIDGYPVTNPIGFRGKEVVVQLYTAFAPMIHIGALEKTAKELDLDLLAVAAEPFAVARSVVGNDPNGNMNAILMDIGGGTTDIAVVSEGGVQGTEMFGIGGRAFTHAIEKDLSLDYEQAESVKLALSSGRVPENKVELVENSLAKTLEVWVDGIELALGEFGDLDHLPQHILLCGGGSSLEMLVEKLNNGSWYHDLPFTKQPIIRHIKPTQVVGIADETGAVADHTFITAMGLLRVGLGTLQQDIERPGGSIREKLDKILRT